MRWRVHIPRPPAARDEGPPRALLLCASVPHDADTVPSVQYLFAAIDARQARLAGKGGSGRMRNHATELKKLIVEASEGVVRPPTLSEPLPSFRGTCRAHDPTRNDCGR